MQSFSADLIDLCEKHGMHSFVAAFTVVGGDHNHHFGMLSGGWPGVIVSARPSVEYSKGHYDQTYLCRR
jgi:hypothetical protein